MIDDASALDLTARFECLAEEARSREEAYRREAAARIGTLERERAIAFGRLSLARTAIDAIAQAQEAEQAPARARFAIASALGWDEIGPPQARVLDALMPFLNAVQGRLRPGASATGAAGEDDPAAALATFEAWYRDSFGDDFYALFDRYMPETPRVDF